jgi:hypothetical protein
MAGQVFGGPADEGAGAEFCDQKLELFSVHGIVKIKVFGTMIWRGVSILVCWRLQGVLE